MIQSNGDVDDDDCRPVKSGTFRSSPTHNAGDPSSIFDSPPLAKQEVDPGRGDLPSDGHLYSRNGLAVDWMTASDVHYISDEVDYVDDRRFSERLASFRDDSFDNDVNRSLLATPERPYSAPRHLDGSVSDLNHLSAAVNDTAAGNVAVADDCLFSDADQRAATKNSSQDEGSVSMRQGMSDDASGQSTVVDCSSSSPSMTINDQCPATRDAVNSIGREMTDETCTHENVDFCSRDNVMQTEREVIVINGNTNCKQRDEITANLSIALPSVDSSSSKDDVIVENDLSTRTTPMNISARVLARNAVSVDADCDVVACHCLLTHEVDQQIRLADDDGSRDRRTRQEDCICLSKELYESGNVLPYNDNKRPSSDATRSNTAVVSRDPTSSTVPPSSTAGSERSFVVVDIDIGEGRPSSLSEHGRRLEAMKRQLLDARPVPPVSSGIDETWNSRTAGKLTPAARSRSAVWTPYDSFFSDATTRQLATDDRIWRTTSLQTLPRKSTPAALDVYQSGSAADLQSENKASDDREGGRQDEMSFDKSRSESDLRRTETERPRLHVYEIGSVDGEPNRSKDTSAASLTRLPSEEFIRRSLERLNLPDWYLNPSSLLRKKVMETDRKHPDQCTPNAPSCSAVDDGQPTDERVERQSLSEARTHVTTHVPVTMANNLTPVSVCKPASSLHFDTSDRLHRESHRGTDSGATADDDVLCDSTENVSAAKSRNREQRHRKRATKTANNEYLTSTGDQETSQSQTEPNQRLSGRLPSESTVYSSVSSSKLLQAPTTDSGDKYNNWICSPAVQPTVNHKAAKTRAAAIRGRLSAQRDKQVPVENDENDTVSSVVCNSYQASAVNGGIVNVIGQHKPSIKTSDEHSKLAVRPRTLRLRRVKPTTRSSEDVTANNSSEMSARINDQNIGERGAPESSLIDSAKTRHSREKNNGLPAGQRTVIKHDLTEVTPNTGTALETLHKPGYNRDIRSTVSHENYAVAADGKKRKEERHQRRRRRPRHSACTDESSQATNGYNDLVENKLTAKDDDRAHLHHLSTSRSLIEPVVESTPIRWEVSNGEREELITAVRRSQPPTSTEAPSCESKRTFLRDEQECDSRDVVDRLTTSSVQRRTRRRLRNDSKSRLDVERQRQETDDQTYIPIQTLVSEDASQSDDQQCRQSLSVPAFSSSDRCSSLINTAKPTVERSRLKLPEEKNVEMTSSCRSVDTTLSTSHVGPQQPRRSAAAGRSSSPVNLYTPEVAGTHLQQDGSLRASTNCSSESSFAERKQCLSAAARRCQRVNRARRSR